MENLGLYSVFDEKGGRYDTPFVAINDVNAVRHFQLMIKNNGTMVSTFKNDFTVQKVGVFNVLTGEINAEQTMLFAGKSLEQEDN